MSVVRTFLIAGIVCACVDAGYARRSPNAELVEKTFIKGPEVGRYSNDLLEDALLDVPDLIRKYGYPVELHNVITEDGYILEIHRIPHGRDENNVSGPRKPAVLIQHGLYGSSADYVIMGPGNAFAYMLAEFGFDVWLGNARGNYYSRKHVSLDPDARETRDQFWNFSWEEIGAMDLTAMIDHILATTGESSLHYVGHSQGTTTFYVMGSLRPEYNAKITSMQSFAPVAYMQFSEHLVFTVIAPYANTIEMLGALVGFYEISHGTPFTAALGRRLCGDGAITQSLCENILFIMAGGSAEFLNATMLPVLLGHAPGGGSLRQMAHYGQLIGHDHFRRFDHGLLQNWRKYWTFTPPDYDLSLVTAPVHLHYVEVDPFSHLDDVERLWVELGRPAGKHLVPHPSFGHLDFAFGIGANSLLYEPTIEIMMSYENTLLLNN